MDQGMINPVLVHGKLKAMQQRIQADASFNRQKSFPFELLQQLFLFVIMKSVHYLICQSYESVNIADWSAEIFMQQPDGGGKGSAVFPGNVPAAVLADRMKRLDHNASITNPGRIKLPLSLLLLPPHHLSGLGERLVPARSIAPYKKGSLPFCSCMKDGK